MAIKASAPDRRGKNPMKAAFIEQYGGPEVLNYGDLPDPVAGPGEVVIDVFAASVNGADCKVRVGPYTQSKFPFVLGRDFSGVISAIDEGVEDRHAPRRCHQRCSVAETFKMRPLRDRRLGVPFGECSV